MKRGWVFIVGVSVTGTLLFFAIQRNLQVASSGKSAGLDRASSPRPTEMVTEPTPSVKDQQSVEMVPSATSPSVNVSQTISQVSSGEQAKESRLEAEIEVPTFLEGTFKIMQHYRAGNQEFLKETIHSAQTSFSRAYEQASKIQASSEKEEKVKQCLKAAALTRLESLRFYMKIRHAQDGDHLETWWEQNIDLLKKANHEITKAVHLTSELIRGQSEFLGADRHAGLMLQNLQENAKGILVVAKSAQS